MNYDTDLIIEISDRANRIRVSANGFVLVDEALSMNSKFNANDWHTIALNDLTNMQTATGNVAHEAYLLAEQRRNDIVKAMQSTLRQGTRISPSHEA